MKAAIVEKPGLLVIKDIDIPKPKDDEVLVRVDSASICNATDGHILHGIFEGFHDFYPQILGHELAGEVVEAGKDVTALKPGDLVAQYTPRGAFCEYNVLKPAEDLWVRVSEKLPVRTRSLVEMAHGAYVQAVCPAKITGEETMLIVGQGPMGLTATGMARLTAGKIIAVDYYRNRLDMAKAMGADVVLNRSELSAAQVVEAVLRETGGAGADVAVMAIAEDLSPDSDAFDMAVNSLRYRGRMTGLVVDVKGIEKNHRLDPHQLIKKDLHFQHILNPIYSSFEDELKAMQFVSDAAADGRLNLDALITHEIGMDELEHAIDLCGKHQDKVVKVVVYPGR
jgi:threonine dehydrogenase-like Zn-dependent dehydrogenase